MLPLFTQARCQQQGWAGSGTAHPSQSILGWQQGRRGCCSQGLGHVPQLPSQLSSDGRKGRKRKVLPCITCESLQDLLVPCSFLKQWRLELSAVGRCWREFYKVMKVRNACKRLQIWGKKNVIGIPFLKKKKNTSYIPGRVTALLMEKSMLLVIPNIAVLWGGRLSPR